MKFLAFDQSPRNTAWAFSTDVEKARVEFGEINMSDYGDDDQRLARDLEFELQGLLSKYEPDWVFFEQIVTDFGRFNPPVLYKQFTVSCTIMIVCGQRGINCELVNISDWRKRFLGRNNVPKAQRKKGPNSDVLKEMALTECARRNIYPSSHHQAEAIGILDYGMASKSFDYRWRTKADVERRQQAARREDMQK